MTSSCKLSVWVFLLAVPGFAQAAGPVLTVRDGVLLREGRACRAVGVNYFSLFSRVLKDAGDRSSVEQLGPLAAAGVPFVRFMACGFWPSEQRLYVDDRAEYFRRLDRVVRAAEEAKIGLIPSLFWHTSTVPDLCGEPMDQLGNPHSKSIALIRRYTREVVSRYKDSRAIWGWEFGNEYNLGADLPNAAKHRPAVVPKLGTPAERSERDELKYEHVRVALGAFAEEVRTLDRERPLFTGHSLPRTSAWNNRKSRSWKADTAEQFREILLRDNPDPFETVTVHVYPRQDGKYPGPAGTVEACVGAVVGAAGKKAVFVGEFGVERSGDAKADRAVFEAMLAAIRKHEVPLAAVWVFDLPMQEKGWNIAPGGDRAWMVEAIGRANGGR